MAQARKTFMRSLAEQGDVVFAAAIFCLLAVLMVPLPPLIIDLLVASSISVSVLLFLSALFTDKPVDFSVFPTLLLVVTVFRLGLNVATTRVILLHGHESEQAAGRIIESFGQFVVGGDYLVGSVVFIILVLVNFVVITKGSGRVAEVAARFTLDAMPGKQMAIDAELNAGLIDERTARQRRAEVTREADFHGAMDGASKFVRGDAIAGIAITLVNIIGGSIIGAVQHGLGLSEALARYAILTIGDGLAGQVPALLVSTAAGMLVTRVSDVSDRSLPDQIGGQLFANPRVLGLAAGAMGVMALVPGLHLPFATLAALTGALAWYQSEQPPPPPPPKEPTTVARKREADPEDLLPVDPLAIELGADLLYLVDERNGGELQMRIQRIRNQFAEESGLVLPPIHLRDDLNLSNGEYRILLRGEEIARGRVYPRQHLALDPGTATRKLQGIEDNDPVFGLKSYWIPASRVLDAQSAGYTVVDVPTVVTTHLVELMAVHGHELYDGAQLDRALERVGKSHPKLVEDLVPEPLSRQGVLRVFRNLLREGLSVRDGVAILEALADYAPRTKDPDVLTEFVRQRLARQITRRFSEQEVVRAVTLAPEVEDLLLRGLQSQDGQAPTLNLDPGDVRTLLVRIRELVEGYQGPGQAVLLCPPIVRGALRRLVERVLPRVPLVSSAEILPTARIETVGTIRLKSRGA